MSAPLTGLSNFRTEPSGKEILIMATTWEESEHGAATGAGRRWAEAGKRHECARPAESSSDGGQFRGSGEKQPIHALGDNCRDAPSQAGVLACRTLALPGAAHAERQGRALRLIGAGQQVAAPRDQPEMSF